MTKPRGAPFGAWKSPVTADLITGNSIGFVQVALDGDDVYWVEQRSAEGGRGVAMRRGSDGNAADLLPDEFNLRSRVHEYGGAPFAVREGTLWFSNDSDQRVWMLEPGGTPRALTPGDGTRYADFSVDMTRRRLICVAESQMPDREPENFLAAISFDGGVTPFRTGHDFYAAPRLSPSGQQIAWLCWNHPNMPWDGTELWLADLDANGMPMDARRIAGGPDISVFQPEWSPGGELHFVADQTGWWSLYRWADDAVEAIAPPRADVEIGRPLWQFGMTTYGFAENGDIVAMTAHRGEWRVERCDVAGASWRQVELPFVDFDHLCVSGRHLAFVGTGDTEPAVLALADLADGNVETLRSSAQFSIDSGFVSAGRAVEFPTAGGESAHGFFYPPCNRDFGPPDGALPPLIVKIHGGPTSQARRGFALKIQYWTSRGFALLDVNYRGSTGFGTAFRRKLDGQWGVADVEDCVAGARWLAGQGLVDPDRMIITGGSAGGYTVLAALAFHDLFKAGASHYGIGDLMALADDTHKFESRYLDRLVGPLPAAEAIWRDRSPINHVDGLNCPVIFFQGLDDRVVPPNQAEAMVAALKSKGIRVAYVPFTGEGHGFRRAENIKRALEGELFFYGRVFGFEPADRIEPVDIENS